MMMNKETKAMNSDSENPAVQGPLVPAHQADVPTIKRLQKKCEKLGIVTGLASCPGGG
jgi:hypothetical protein